MDDLTGLRGHPIDAVLVQQTFEHVVAPHVRDRLLGDPGRLRLDGLRQPVTILFAGIHEFSYFSEGAPPDISFEVLNTYLSVAAQAILNEEGTLDRFAGSAVMAIWNAPISQADHALRAVRAAVAMDQAVKAHRSLLDYTYRLYFSSAIVTGEALVGNVGSADLFTYTAIGETVDLARRLESVANPGQILLSRATYQSVVDRVIARELSPAQAERLADPVVAYELLSEVF